MFDVFYSGTKPNLFVHEQPARDIEHARSMSRTRYFWWVNYLTDYTGWDFLWEPVPWESQYTHTWPSQHHEYSGTYLVPTHAELIEYKFHKKILPNKECRTNYCTLVNDIDFDWTWHPHPMDPPYNYVFGNQWWAANRMPTVEYPMPGATETKYIFTPRAVLPEKHNSCWRTLVDCEWDYSWVPDPGDPPYIYVFGNQWHRAEIMPTVEYHALGATERKYLPYPRALLIKNIERWSVPGDIDSKTVDYTWVPDPGDPPYIYQFGTQHQATGGPQYCMPGATDIKYVSSPRARRTQVDDRWCIPENTNLEAFDFTWHPDGRDPPYRYQFGTQWNRAGGPEYCVPGATKLKYTTAQVAKMLPTDKNWVIPDGIDINSFDFSWTPDTTEQPFIYEFGTQWQKTGGPRYHVPGATEVKYITEPRSIKTSIDNNWTVPDKVDTASFDFTWHPDATESPYQYQFGTQHQRTGGPQYKMPGAIEVKYIDQLRITTDRVATAIYEIDHLDGNTGLITDTVKTVRYFDNYLDTLRRIAKSIPAEHEFVWICSSICDYTDFDFTWHPEQWQASMLHVFPSNGEKFGDTFFMHVPTFQYRAEKCQLLEWYDLNFMDISVPRRPMPVIHHDNDTHVSVVQQTKWAGPLAVFTNRLVDLQSLPAVSLWRQETKTIVPLDAGSGVVIVPSCAVSDIRTQLYDWSRIDKTRRNTFPAQQQDVVFISYDEPDADRNWEILKDRCPRAQRIHGVAGMELALEAAADLSATPWYYAVFAKTRLYEQFDFSFVPDYMQQPKHYIFNSRNTTNGLEYGHMGIVLYNCKGVRAVNQVGNFGLDYTLSFLHESVPVLSCYGDFAITPYHAWRTAFRETAKLAYFETQQQTVEGAYRLNCWLAHAEGANAEWCLKGAQDGYEFFVTTQGDLSLLKQSFKWEWLRNYFTQRYDNLE